MKCFSSFVHTTCPLSDSPVYLASDGAHHPFGQKSQSALLSAIPVGCRAFRGGTRLKLSAVKIHCYFPRIARGCTGTSTPQRRALRRAFGGGLLSLRSPLLRESLLVPSPPLSEMLQFSGSSCSLLGPLSSVSFGFCFTLPLSFSSFKTGGEWLL